MTKTLKTLPKSPRATLSIILSAILLVSMGAVAFSVNAAELEPDCTVNLSDLTVTEGDSTSALTVYTADDCDAFYTAYTNGTLPDIYVTKFIFDGTGILKKYSLDDYTKEIEVEDISVTAININTTGNIEFTGTATKTMIMINSNGVSGDINLMLNNVSLTSNKKAPAILVANKDVTYTACNITIIPESGTTNYIAGGKISKTSLMDKDNLSGTYATYSGYYGIYSADDLENVIFAKETADSEKLSEGAPEYYFHESGAISSDIALTFNGSGSLEVVSLKDEGIETKGDLIFTGGTGDYSITSLDDCLNASTSGTKIYIDVNSMLVNVSSDADEGDGIDSNGYIYIEGGTIIARASASSQDAGIDSDNGTYINGGTVIGTGNMTDEIQDSSNQHFIYLNFGSQLSAGTTIVVTDSSDNPVAAYTSDRTFTNIVLSSSAITEGTYHVYRDGELVGESENGLYTSITSYSGGTQQCYTSTGSSMGGPGGQVGPGGEQGGDFTPPTDSDGNQMTPPDGTQPSTDSSENSDNTQQSTNVSDSNGNNGAPQPPTDSDGNMQTPPDGNFGGQDGGQGGPQNQQTVNSNGSVDFEITSSQHTFSGVTDYTGIDTDNTNITESTEATTAEETTEATEPTTSTSSAKLNQTTKTLKAGATFTLKVSGTSEKVSFSSTNSKVATVSKNGVVTALKKGSATIKATVDGKTLKCKVNVKNSASAKINGKTVKSANTYSVTKGSYIIL